MHFFVPFFWQRVGVGNVLLCLLLYKQEELFLNKCLHVTLALEQVFHEAVTKGFLSITTLKAAETNTAGSPAFVSSATACLCSHRSLQLAVGFFL